MKLYRTRKINIFRTLDELAKVIYKNLLDLDAAFPGVCAFQTFSFLCSFGKLHYAHAVYNYLMYMYNISNNTNDIRLHFPLLTTFLKVCTHKTNLYLRYKLLCFDVECY